MNNEQLTTDELYSLRQACTWSVIYWDAKRDELEKDDPRRVAHSHISREYLNLWQKVDGVITAQESALVAVNG